jgi:hypothetical protein
LSVLITSDLQTNTGHVAAAQKLTLCARSCRRQRLGHLRLFLFLAMSYT